MLKNETASFYFIFSNFFSSHKIRHCSLNIYIYIYIYIYIEREEWEEWAYIIESSAKLSQQINQIMAQNPLLPNAVEPLPASLNVHHFSVAHLHLHHHNRKNLINYRSPHTPHRKNQTKSSHPARTDNPPRISPPRAASNLSSHLHASIGSQIPSSIHTNAINYTEKCAKERE